VRKTGAEKLDPTEQIGRNDVVDLRVGAFIDRGKQAVAGVAEDYCRSMYLS